MATDRTQYKQVLLGALGSLRTIANAANVVSQDASRFYEFNFGVTATTANANYKIPVVRAERPLQVREVRILPGGALNADATNYQIFTYGYTNDNSATITALGTINTTPTANSGTGNWAFGTSLTIPATSNTNPVVPAGSQIVVTANFNAAGVVIPALSRIQILAEDV